MAFKNYMRSRHQRWRTVRMNAKHFKNIRHFKPPNRQHAKYTKYNEKTAQTNCNDEFAIYFSQPYTALKKKRQYSFP